MILGRDRHPAAACFDELDAAVEALRPPGAPPVVFNGHAFPHEIPPGAIVYNLENVGLQVSTDAFPGHQIWDFSDVGTRAWGGRAVHVPVGYHPTMTRFAPVEPPEQPTWDVAFAGAMNDRRRALIADLEARGLRVIVLPYHAPLYGAQRDAILASTRLVLNVRYYENGVFPVLRAAHCVANHVPVLSEETPDAPSWSILEARYETLAQAAADRLAEPEQLALATAHAYDRFVESPLRLPT